MLKNAVTIQYHDFHPSEQSRNFIQAVVNGIQQELPRGSKVKATFTLQDNLVKGMLQVGSYGGPFFSVAVAEDLKEVTMRLVEQMRRRVEKFKSKQHKREGLKNRVPHILSTPEQEAYDSGVA